MSERATTPPQGVQAHAARIVSPGLAAAAPPGGPCVMVSVCQTMGEPGLAARIVTEVDFSAITAYQRYKLMASLIVPRPIALVTTVGPSGIVNAAPFSMFNMVGEDPPILMISINRLHDGRLKDTAANILHNGEFVVHMSDEPMAQKMHACGEAFPSDVSELVQVGLTAVASHTVKPPRIQESPVAFECVLHEKLETDSRYVFIGRIVWLAARTGLIDTQAWRVNLRDYSPVARFGASFYTRSSDRFSLSGESREAPTHSTAIDQL